MVKEGYKQTEVGVIPVDWEVVELGNLLQFKNGINATKEQYGTGYKFINVLDIIENEFITHDKIIGRVNVDASSYLKNEVNHGDIVFQRSSETAEEVGQAAVYLDEENSATFGGFVILGKKAGDFDSRYLNYQLQSPACRREIVNQSGGSTRYNISQVSLRKAKTILPPTLPEQRAIARALSDTDALLAALDALIGKKEAFKRGMMEGLLSGERRLEGFGGAWEEVTVGASCTVEMGQSPSSIYYNETGHGLPLVQGNADIKNRKSIIRNYSSVTPKICSAGDILISVRAPVGEIAIASHDSCLGRGVAALKNLECPSFFYQLMIYKEGEWSRYSKGSTFESITSEQVRDFEIFLPPLPEQRAIATVLSDLDGELLALRLRRAKLAKVKAGMMGELLTGAVRLV